MQVEAMFSFWGKAEPHSPRQPKHPLVWHCLDVAAVLSALLDAMPGALRRLTLSLGMNEEFARTLLVRLAALHDIGKFHRSFQAKAPEFFPPFAAMPPHAKCDHASAGFQLFQSDPGALCLGIDASAVNPLVSAAVGHHGKPPSPHDRGGAPVHLLAADWGAECLDAAKSFAAYMERLLPLPSTAISLSGNDAQRSSHAVAGLVVLADWIGSKQAWFPYESPPSATESALDAMAAYYAAALRKASEAVRLAGVRSGAFAPTPDLGELLLGRLPRPLQEWAVECSLPPGPSLHFIEAETGAGKTEAALALAQRIVHRDELAGIYLALPTMATANAMFDRARIAAGAMKADTGPLSMVLSHSARDMHPGFMENLCRDDGGHSHESASAHCTEWLVDDRRRAFFADLAVGTVDQAIMSVLPCRHQAIRLFGLSNRVLVVDEAHSYDAYMLVELGRLLEFHAAFGSSAIVLSATLSASARRFLADSFMRGCKVDPSLASQADDAQAPYPCVAEVTAREARILPLRPSVPARRIEMHRLDDCETALRHVLDVAGAGGCSAYLRNSVQDALDAHAHAASLIPQERLHLLHSHMALCDRLAAEERALKVFGPGGTRADRQGSLLIATQIAEQSLDLDFDAMSSDLAPVDAIIQRAGRMRRHERNGRMGDGAMRIVSPEPLDDADADWLKAALPKTARVYSDHAALWRTAKVLFDAGGIDFPDGLRMLVEGVFGAADSMIEIPPELVGAEDASLGKSLAAKGQAHQALLALSQGYLRGGKAWVDDAIPFTRLIEVPVRTVRLGVAEGDALRPWAPEKHGELRRRWRMSELRLPTYKIDQQPEDAVRKDPLLDAASAHWPKWDAAVTLKLERDADGVWRAHNALCEGDPCVFRYSPLRGLESDGGFRA